MAFLFGESFDGLATADLPRVFQYLGSGGYAVSAGNGRFGGNAFRATTGNGKIGKGIATSQTVYAQFWMRWSGSLGTASILNFWDGTTGFGNLVVRMNVDGSLSVHRQGGNVTYLQVFDGFSGGAKLGQTAAGLIAASTGVLVTVMVTLDATVGVVKIWLNGNASPVLSLTGQNTVNSSGSANCTLVILGMNATVGTVDYDDWLIWNDQAGPTGDGFTTFIGDLTGETLFVSGAGTTTQWAASGAASNYQCVDDPTPDGDSTYVTSNTVGQKDTYQHTALTRITTGVQVVVVRAIARQTTAGSRGLGTVLRSGAVENVGSTVTLGTDYAAIDQARFVDPNTSAAWVAADVSTTEIGEVVAA